MRHRCVWLLSLHLFVFRSFLCGFLILVFMRFWHCKWRSKRANCRRVFLWSKLVSVVFRQLLERFSSDQLCSVIRRTLRAYATPSAVLTRCSSVRSLLPSHTADFQLRFGITRSQTHLWKMSKHRFTKLQHLSTIRTTQCTIERRLCIILLEAKNEPSFVSKNPLHQCTVSGRSALSAVLQCCQHCAHLSLQLVLTVFHCTVALMRSSAGSFG